MLLVGLTGGIGAGKSTVARRLAELGAVVVDADRLARDVVAPGTEGLRDLVARFGPQVLGPDGALDRTSLAALVFQDEAARRDLESIVHPLVAARTAQSIAAAPPDAVVVNDVPLLVEAGLAATYHLVVVVTAAEGTRVARLAGDRGMSREQALQRIRAQAGDAARVQAADAVLSNDGTAEDLAAQVDALWRDRLLPYEENLRLGRPASSAAVSPDAAPGHRLPRMVARLCHTLGAEPGVAVAGPADGDGVLRVRITSPAGWSVAALRGRLDQAGFPRDPRDPDLHRSADPGNPVALTVGPPRAAAGGTP